MGCGRARAGRRRYEQIAAAARRFSGSPQVRAARRQAQGAAAQKARDTVSSVAQRVRGGGSGTHAGVSGVPGAPVTTSHLPPA